MSRSTAAWKGLPSGSFLSLSFAAAVGIGILCNTLRPASAEVTGPGKDDRPITVAITSLMSRQHLTRHPFDNEISNRWLNNYLKMLDGRKLFFTKADVDGFMDYKDQLDDMA